jgi:carboxylesterase
VDRGPLLDRASAPPSGAGLHLHGGRNAVLVLHGLGGTPLEVRLMGKMMQRAGFSVFIPSLPGFSAGSKCTRWEEWLKAAQAVYAALSASHASVAIAGLSAGATLALAVAAQEPRPTALVLWSVTLDYDGWAMPWYRWLLEPCYRLGIGRGYVYRECEPYGLKNERWRARVAQALSNHGVSAVGAAGIPAEFLYQATRMARHVERHLGRVRGDVLIVHAADDETASPRNADAVYHGISARTKRRIMLGDSYHIVTMDNERDLVARESIRFLQESVMRDDPSEHLKVVSSARAVLRLQRRAAAGRGW